MNDLIIIIIIFTIIIGIIFSFWSIKQTRQKYYDNFINQRNNRKKQKDIKND